MKKDTDRQALMDASVRIERILWLDGIDWSAPPDDWDEVMSDVLDTVHPSARWLTLPPDWVDLERSDDVAEWLYELEPSGFVVVGSCPVPVYDPESKSYSHSWSRYRTQVVITKTPQEAVPLLVEWAEGMREKARKDATSTDTREGA